MPSQKYPVIDAQSAIKDYNKKYAGFQDIQSRIRPASDKLLESGNQEPSLDDHMRANGVPTTFSLKANLAKKIGMRNYTGKPNEDKAILAAITNATSQSENNNKNKSENDNKDREFALKQKELALKEKEINNKKMPGADEIAQSLMNKFNQQ